MRKRYFGRPRLVLGAWHFLFLILAGGAQVADPIYPLRVSANGRYLVDQNDVPYLMTGDSPQALIVALSEAQTDAVFANRWAHGFNTVWITLLCTTYTGGRPDASTRDGIRPFSATLPSTKSVDLTTPNQAYFSHVDRVINLAAKYGIQVLLDPIETGGFLSTMLEMASQSAGRSVNTWAIDTRTFQISFG